MMSDPDPRYPIGRFDPPELIDEPQLARWREAVARAPDRLRQAIDGLSGSQLDTAYRDGGWTVRQVVHHLPDAHLHTYLRFKWALAEAEPAVAAYDPAGWAGLADSLHGPVEPALQLYEALHARWGVLLGTMEAADFERCYLNPRTGEARSLAYTLGLYAWHGEHHVAQIETLQRRSGW